MTSQNATIVVISDGGDNASTHTADATASLFLTSSWPPIFALILDYEETAPRRGYFKKIPGPTGGLIIYPSSASKVPSETRALTEIVLNPTVMRLQLSKPTTESAKIEVDLVREDGKTNKDINVLHVAKLMACGSHEAPH